MIDSDAPQALAGLRVLDLSTALAAPLVCTLLGDFGAEVIKVEQPRVGDYTRAFADEPVPGGRSVFWLQEGRNKKSVTIDLNHDDGPALVRRLVAESDVVVTNYRPGTLKRWGIAPHQLLASNPQAVIACITGYGLTGPYRERGSFDRIASAFSGLTYVSGEPDRPPVRVGYSVVDYMTGYLAAFAVMTALRHREVGGGAGQIVDLALYEAAFRASESALLTYAANGAVRERTGSRTGHIIPAGDFDTADGRRISLHAGTQSLFERLAEAIERPELVADPRFASLGKRAANREALYAIVEEWVARHTADDAVRRLEEHGVPASPLLSIADIAHHPHYRERGTIVEVEDHEHGRLPMVAPLPHLSVTPGAIRDLGPALGEHVDDVLTGLLGMSADEVAALRASGVV